MNRVLPKAERSLPSFSDELNKNDFKYISNLGEGSFGKVYKVLHRPTETQYAIKVVPKDKMKSSSMLKQIRNEIQIMQSINHPKIVQLMTYFENDANIYLVLELGGVI